MKKRINHVTTAARLLLGLVFFVFGLNGFFQFIPMPEPPAAAGAFLGALGATGYAFPLLKGTEVVVGALLFWGRWVPLALTVLAPITVNILAFHMFLKPGDVPMGLVILGLHLFLAYRYRASFRPLLQAQPDREKRSTEPARAWRERRAAG